MTEVKVKHLHTYFLFPFSIDQEAVMQDHPEIWQGHHQWFSKLDRWVTEHVGPDNDAIAQALGGWERTSHHHFDLRSATYQDMVFFHPFVRRAFFDTGDDNDRQDALLRSYAINLPPESDLFYEAQDHNGGAARVAVNQLQLLLFANGIGILSIGVFADDISFPDALWINEMMRKIYASSDRQLNTGRIPCQMTLVLEQGGERRILAEENFHSCMLAGFRPKISNILLALLYFVNYSREELDPVLDERMVVNTFAGLDGEDLPAGYQYSEDYDVVVSRFLYVDRYAPGFRYDPAFTREELRKDVYRRWQHEGTLYGMTSYSNVTITFADSKSLVHRMFTSKNRLIAIIALFYRATLLDFARKSARVSRELFPLFSGQAVQHHHIQLATRLMSDFHYFNNYWFFSELTPKDEELEHFQLLCSAYRIGSLKKEIEERIEKLSEYIDRLYSLRNSDAVNRLALMSVILGIGALVTGFYGMNIPSLAADLAKPDFSMGSYIAAAILTLVSLSLIIYVVSANWVDYRSSLFPRRYRRPLSPKSFRRLPTRRDS